MPNILSEKRVDGVVARTVATMAFEGLYCDDEDKSALYRVARGETTADMEIKRIIKDFRMRRKEKND